MNCLNSAEAVFVFVALSPMLLPHQWSNWKIYSGNGKNESYYGAKSNVYWLVWYNMYLYRNNLAEISSQIQFLCWIQCIHWIDLLLCLLVFLFISGIVFFLLLLADMSSFLQPCKRLFAWYTHIGDATLFMRLNVMKATYHFNYM